MQHQRATRRAVLKSIADGATGLFAVSFRARGLRAQSAPALKFGRVPVNALVSNYIGPVDFFRDEGVPIEPVRVDNPGQLFQAMTAGDLAVGEIGLGPSLIAVTRGLPLLSLFLGAPIQSRECQPCSGMIQAARPPAATKPSEKPQ